MKNTRILSILTLFIIVNNLNSVFAQSNQYKGTTTAIYSDTIEALHYTICLTDINQTSKSIKGYTEILLKSHINNLSVVKFELASLLVDSVILQNSNSNSFSQSVSNVFINLPSPLFINDTLTIGIYYHGVTFVDPSGWGGFHFYNEYAYNLGVGFDAIPHNLGKAWFPCIDDFHDRALYDVHITVPNTKKAISGGQLQQIVDNGNGTSTWHWKTDYTLPTYLISASIGFYELKQDTYNGIERQIPITFYSRPSDTAKIAGTFANLKNILQVFETHFGPYPLERVGYTATEKGAMEHACNISYPFSGWNGTTTDEWWYAHELSHMWFGDAVTCASAEDMWLNEGWAVWCESLYREILFGKQAYMDNMRSKLKEVLLNTYLTDGGYFALYGIPQTITYGSTVYDKGGQVTHTLRNYMGDELFFPAIKAYLQQFKYYYASTYDLRDFLSAYSGMDLNPFFDAWVFSPGFPHFSIDSIQKHASDNGFEITVFVRQRWKGASLLANNNHLEICFLGSSWQKVTDTIVFSGATGMKTFFIPFEPIAVMADLDEKISDATTDQAYTIKTTGETNYAQSYAKVITDQILDSAYVRITHNWVAPDSLHPPVPGLRISDSRYWTVEGIFPSGFKAKGKFTYSKTVGLDNTLITNSKDSLVILYRKNSGSAWMPVSFVKLGGWMGGSITVDTLRAGEYALAIWDRLFLKANQGKQIQESILNISPNPAKEACKVSFNIDETANLAVFDTTGKQLFLKSFAAGNHDFIYTAQTNSSTILIFRLTNEKGREIECKKIVFNK